MLLRTFIVCAFLTTTNLLSASIVTPIKNYYTDTYNAGTQNWQIHTHRNGWIYFANNNGLLEFDGNNWAAYKIKGANAVVRAMEINYTKNTIYAGGDNEYGYFSPTELGTLAYTSLSEQLPDSLKNFGQVWGIVLGDDCIYVRTDYKLIKHNTDGTFNDIPTKGHVYGIIKSGETIFIDSQNGLGIITGSSINSVQDNGLLKDKVVRGICCYGNGGILIATQKNGIFIYDGDCVKPFRTDVDNILKDGDIFSITANNNHIALGFINKGVAVTDIAGKNVQWFNTKNGLANNTILSMVFDNVGNLWLGLDNGIDRISFGSPTRYLYGRDNFMGAGYAACVYNGALYIGTNQGVFKSVNKGNDFSVVTGCTGQIWSLDIIGNTLICSSDNGLFYLNGNTLSPISTSTGFWRVRKLAKAPLGADNGIIAGRYSGFVTVTKTNGNYTIKKLKGIDVNPRIFEIDKKGNIILSTNNKLLCGTINNDTIEYKEIAVTQDGSWSIRKIDNNIVVSSPTTVATINDNYKLDTGNPLLEKLSGAGNYPSVVKTANSNLWFIKGDTIFIRHNNGKLYNFMDNDGLRVGGFESLFALPDNNVLIGSHKGFLIPDTTAIKKYDRAQASNPIVRRVLITTVKDSIVYGQSFTNIDKDVVLDYKYNSLRFIMGGAGVTSYSHIKYSYMLEPIEKHYGAYLSSNSKEYTNLDGGSYTLHIKCKNSFTGKEGYTTYKFKVNPPFYRSWWAYVIYAIIILAILYMLYLILHNRVQQSKRKLEIEKDREILACQRTINEERLIKEKEILTLKNEQTEINLKLKTKELANITLSRINHNDTLSSIKADLKKIATAIKSGDYNGANSKILALQTNISENMDTDVDWNKFEDDFNVTHLNFITKLKEAYPNLTKKEIKLCVYIKMGLLTKEIAPLMNISVRGAEMLRFRMRKKMGVNSDVDLTTLFERL